MVLYDTTTWHHRTLTLPYVPNGLAFVDGGARFVTPSYLASGRVDLWDTATLQPVGEPLTLTTADNSRPSPTRRGTKVVFGSSSGVTPVLDVDPTLVATHRLPPRRPQPHPHRMGPVLPGPGLPQDLRPLARGTLNDPPLRTTGERRSTPASLGTFGPAGRVEARRMVDASIGRVQAPKVHGRTQWAS